MLSEGTPHQNREVRKGAALARRTLGLLFLANLLNFYNRQIVAALAEAIKAEFALTDAQVGVLNSAFETTYPLAAVTLALAADRWGRQRIISLVIALWSGASALTGAAGSYLVLLLARLGVGLGQGGYGPSAVATLAAIFPKARRSQAVALHDVGMIVGSAVAYLLSGLLAQALGWRVSFFVAGLPGFLLAWLIWRLGATAPPPPISRLTRRRAGQFLGVRTLRIIYVSGILFYLTTAGIVFWLPTFMQRFHGYTLASAAATGGALQVVVGATGVLAGGWAADRLAQRHPGGRLLTAGLALIVATPLAFVAVLTPSRSLFLAAASPALFFYAFNLPCIGPQIYAVTPAGFGATAQALYLLLAHYLGSLPSAPLIGWLSDSGQNLRSGMVFLPGIGLLAALVMLWGARFVGRDVTKSSISERSPEGST